MKKYETLYQTLSEVQKEVIGIVKLPGVGIYGLPGVGIYGLIVKKEEFTITSIYIGFLLGVSTDVIPKGKYTEIYFPDNKTLSEMMEDPLKFDEWWKNNF